MAEAVQPWFEVVDRLRAEKGLSQDDLAYEARHHGAPSTLTGSWISQLRAGKRPLGDDVLRGLAGALEIGPEQFTEYRLHRVRRLFDEREIGLSEAAANLASLETAVDQGGLPAPPGELGQLLKDVSPNPPDRRPEDSPGRRPKGRRRHVA